MSDGLDDASGTGDMSDISDTPGATPGEGDSRSAPWPLRQATAQWVRRGYTVRYSDAFLTQLARRTGLGWVGWALIALALPCLGAVLWLIARALRRRGWHVISLAITPEGRVISHRQWSRSEPS